MTVQEKPSTVVGRVVDGFVHWLKHRRELREMREMDAANFSQIAGELRMTSADLEALVRQGPHAADELPSARRRTGIDQEALARTSRWCCATWARSVPTTSCATAIHQPHRCVALRRVLATLPPMSILARG